MTTMTGVLADFVAELVALTEHNAALKARVEELEQKQHDNQSKLTKHEVQDIRAAYQGGMSQSDLAAAYGVNPATISRTVRGIYHR